MSAEQPRPGANGPICPLISLDAVLEELRTVKDSVPTVSTDLYEIGWRRAAARCTDAIAHRFLVDEGFFPQPAVEPDGDPPLTHIQTCASWQSNDPATACDCDKQITPDADPLADTYGSRCDDDEVVA